MIVDGKLRVDDALSREQESRAYSQATMAGLSSIDNLIEFLQEHFEDVGT